MSVGFCCLELNSCMTKTITEKKLNANRKNSMLGGEAIKKRFQEEYILNPSYCNHCKILLPQSKKRNKFCSNSCSATFNNTGKQKVPRYKCNQCENLIIAGKYCSTICCGNSRRKYKTEEEAIIARRKKVREVSANYRVKLKNQTPEDVDRIAIKEFYDNCPLGHEVDHIIPISKGGLHVLENLQYLTITENRRKGSKII